MWYFCKYKDFFGKPGEGLHRYRIFNLALVDIFATLVLAWVLQRFYFIYTDYLSVLLFTFIVGILLHRLFCVRTTIDKFLFK
tara:strand:- start:904 stop:1149 length:246 start_codon:yes stop_codon:yes gene_type:complete